MTVKVNLSGVEELDFPAGVTSATTSAGITTINLTASSGGFNGVNAQSGTSYTVVNGDNLKLVTLNNAGAVGVTLPQAGSGGNFNSTWAVFVENLGAGIVTVTPTTSTIDGAVSITLRQNQGVAIFSDGTNYFTERGLSSTSITTGSAGVVIDGAGSTPTLGSKGYIQVPYSGTITSWTLLADAVGSAQITVKKSTYAGFPTTASIVAAAPPVLVGVQKNTSSTLTGWTTSITAGDVLEFNLDSATTVLRLVLELQITKS